MLSFRKAAAVARDGRASRAVLRVLVPAEPQQGWDIMETREPDRTSRGARLTILAERCAGARETARGTTAGPQLRKLVTFERLNSVPGADDRAGPDDAPPSVAGTDETAASLARGQRRDATAPNLIAARTRQAANLEAVRICGAKLRRAISLLR